MLSLLVNFHILRFGVSAAKLNSFTNNYFTETVKDKIILKVSRLNFFKIVFFFNLIMKTTRGRYLETIFFASIL
jgi:hypothetical protein